MKHLEFTTPLGNLIGFADDAGLRALVFSDQAGTALRIATSNAADHPLLRELERQVEEYFRGTRGDFDLPLEPEGTPFQCRVWAELRQIAAGHPIAYRTLAIRIGCERGVRAVARAVANNPILIAIPCHRVIGSSGALTGFAAGIERKQALLRLEGWSQAVRARASPAAPATAVESAST